MDNRTQEKIPVGRLLPSAVQIREILGDRGVTNHAILAAWHQARDNFIRIARPQVVYRSISLKEWRKMFFIGNASVATSPIPDILSQSEALVLFCGTIGSEPEKMVKQQLRERNDLDGYLLDRLAAVAADGISHYLAGKFSRKSQLVFLPYSPGYCGWSIEDQVALFSWLTPEGIGVNLLPSHLMRPVKSVSGILIGVKPAIHRFKLTYDCCQTCGTRSCTARMRTIKEKYE